MTKVEASARTVELAALVTFLQTAISFDRPIALEKALQDARDIMLECGFPVANDFRTIGTTKRQGVQCVYGCDWAHCSGRKLGADLKVMAEGG